nr:immunoglobulin light chain junction region [Macaca mulatta]MOX99596.1 immunoglobulin light chain junction region [Macaca mulatta]MOY00041.1 immunoglobulin light chain junction region [Macaca mulatta]MOY00738.1 immunoglobulin light chain junction region [Macaca mulatta]MOY01074.1 immunoglobulin light chain junction region [Macaca mulatta]
CQQCSTVPYSF